LSGEGFEGVGRSGRLYVGSDRSEQEQLDMLTDAVIGTFDAMQRAFDKLDYHKQEALQRFSVQFTACPGGPKPTAR